MRNILTGVVIAATLLKVGVGTPTAAQKNKTPPNPGVTVTFGDRPGDKIVSDGHGPYVNGVGGVEGQLWVDGTGDMTLNLKGTRPNRAFDGSYSPATDVAQPTGAPSGTFSDGWFINVGQIWKIPVGTTVSTRGGSFATGVGDFRWCSDGSFCAGFATTELLTVTRISTDKWTASADAPSSSALGSDLNVLVKLPRGQAIGYYRMPFQMTIQCQTASCS
jgi:hypothetical protein